MGTKKIKIGLSSRSITKASRELETYKRDLIVKTTRLQERIASEIANNAESAFTNAIVDDLIRSEKRIADVDVTVTERGNISVVIANGEDAVWVEFGAGVFHNGSSGSSPHPKGIELGMTIGGYGKGYGKRRTWGFYEDGELQLTRGTQAIMPMYNSVKTVCDNLYTIAKEVWD
jgi:hypothetical protein